MSKKIIKKKEQSLVEQKTSGFSREQIELIKSTVAKNATDDELKLFLYTAERTGLDPLTKQIHFVKRGVKQRDGSYKDQMTIQTGIDGYRAIAERTGELAGITDPLYEVQGNLPSKATVKVYRSKNGMMAEFAASARWSEYAPSGNQAFMWNKMPYLMLGKVAEALALRKAFPLNLSGIYTGEEMNQAEISEPQSEPELDLPAPKKEVSDKTKIAQLCKLLDINVDEHTAEEIKKKTGLDVVVENYPQIVSRLETIYKERNEYKYE